MNSLEDLATECTPNLGNHLVIRAADELHFGDSLLSHHAGTTDATSKSDVEHEERHKSKDAHHKKHTKHLEDKKPNDVHQAIANAKDTVKQALDNIDDITAECPLADMKKEIGLLKKGNAEMKIELDSLRENFKNLCEFVHSSHAVGPTQHSAAVGDQSTGHPQKASKEDEDIDLFGSSDEEEDEEKERIKQERLKAYAEKKAQKPVGIAKSSIILDIKPWDDTTDMQEMEKLVREIQKDGLVWGGAKLIPLAYGIKKLQIICVVEDEKVSVEDLIDQITEDLQDHVQSVDISAFNKI